MQGGGKIANEKKKKKTIISTEYNIGSNSNDSKLSRTILVKL